jgi:hypothetical protein
MTCTLSEWTTVPLDDCRDQLGNDDLGVGPQMLQSRGQREAESQPANQYTGLGTISDSSAGDLGQRVFRSVGPCAHEILSIHHSDGELLAVLVKAEFAATRYRCGI